MRTALDIKLVSVDGRSIRFILSGVTTAFANALRRVISAEVPCMAIDDVFVIENQSVLFDEILAHRLGLVPLTTDLESYVLPEDCACKSDLGCPRCRVALTLDVKAPDGDVLTVYSRDLKSEDPRVVPVSGDIPLVKLAPNQRVRIEAYARLGRGKDHAKWKPVTVCAYKYYPMIDIDAKRCTRCGECVEICPKGVLEVAEDRLVIKDLLGCMSCRDCEGRCPLKPPAIKIGWDESTFVFYVEGTGSLPINRVIVTAAAILREKARTLAQELREA